MASLQKYLTTGLLAVIACLFWLYSGSQQKLLKAQVDLETERESLLLVQESLWDTENAWKKANAFAVQQRRKKEKVQREIQALVQNDPEYTVWSAGKLPLAVQLQHGLHGAQGSAPDATAGYDRASGTSSVAGGY